MTVGDLLVAIGLSKLALTDEVVVDGEALLDVVDENSVDVTNHNFEIVNVHDHGEHDVLIIKLASLTE